MTSKTPVYLIASPIGDVLQDMSVAAIHTLRSVEHVFVEADDEYLARLRDSSIIGEQHHVHVLTEPPLPRVRELIRSQKSFALVASSGIPCFLDPGREVVDLCLEHHPGEVELVPIGMASALDAALCMSGVDCHCFHFNGHYPEQYVFEQDLPNDERALVYFVRGAALSSFLDELGRTTTHVRRLILLKDIRKKGRAAVAVLRPSPAPTGWTTAPPDDAAADFTCVVDRSKR